MEKLLKLYKNFIVQINPPMWWRFIRFVLHWLTLLPKLAFIGGWTVIMHIYMLIKWKKKEVPELTSWPARKMYFNTMLNSLPVFRNGYFQLYVNRVRDGEIPNGQNHIDDHQAARQGTYHFILNKLGLVNNEVRNATRLHLQKRFGLCRGYHYNNSGELVFNGFHTSGDQLLGTLLAIDSDESDEMLREEYAYSIASIIDNDYALLHEDGKTKSDRGMWQPGLETVGAQALTILAALKIGSKIGVRDASKHYKKLLWLYGYGLLSLFPTTFIMSNRGYFNDHNCMIATYLLAKNSKGLGKLYWILVMLYVWSLSYKWYNPYFTGLLKEIAPNILSQEYINDTKAYLFEDMPITYSRDNANEYTTNTFPVSFNSMNQGEFWCDEPHFPVVPTTESSRSRSGLGWITAATMIDPDEAKGYLE